MKVGFHSPLPPAPTGVADYSAALLASLRKRGSISIDSTHADVFLYHLGNNTLHRELYHRALAHPGVVVLHDAVLHHLFLGTLSREPYIEEFAYNYGDWHRDEARDLWDNRARSASERRYFTYPMLRRIAETALAVIVHNPAAARMVLEHAPAARVVEIPHLFVQPELPAEIETFRLRAQWNISASTYVYGVFGYLRETKRLAATLRAFDAVHRADPGTALLIGGQSVSRDLERSLSVDAPGVIRLPYLPGNDFWRAAAAVDACINLRYPAAGETSGIATRMMGIDKPVLVTTGEETSRFPETACLRVNPGLGEQAFLTDYSILLRSFPDLAREIGRRGGEYIRREHSLERVTDAYWKLLCDVGS